ncbi:DUF3955 domain-containing protein [Companilactobacillus huachuanensis]|uniref:DUF3955 domain-containing protein n=1 Tax=Companilactobacillus huachuanensis TaxID=2559914 RepID=A0ABW1RL89_9LACO|nr:DUF3955 domain-containing protein [Companilactobacillus huachuanensis]
MKKARVSRNIMIIALLLGVGCFALFSMIGSTVDSNGILHEPFFLVPFGYFFLLIGIISGAIHWYKRITAK